jgi:hypothetical protein
MLRNTPISPVIKADRVRCEPFFFGNIHFYSAVCSIENKKMFVKRNQKALMNPSVDNKFDYNKISTTFVNTQALGCQEGEPASMTECGF